MKVAPGQSWRLFCALELPEAVRELALTHIARLRAAVPDARASWSRDASLHLTLKFLAAIPETSVPDLSAAASRAVAGLRSFSIRLEQSGVFPQHGPPRVLWLGVNDVAGRLVELHARLEDEAAKEGFEKDERPFHPHLTIARLRQPRSARTLADEHKQMEFEPVEIAVSELLVIRSELRSEGSKYTVISRHPLFGVRCPVTALFGRELSRPLLAEITDG
jgi:2'-5' RNA ligase